jgi:hypothetical protein
MAIQSIDLVKIKDFLSIIILSLFVEKISGGFEFCAKLLCLSVFRKKNE